MRSTISSITILCAVGVALLWPRGVVGQEYSPFALFASDSVIHLRLITDMKTLVKEKMDEEYQPATLVIFDGSGDSTVYEVEVRSRGNIRKEVCYYPPIRVKFPKEQYTHNKLKWVMVCRDSDFYEDALLRELMAYRMFEALTENSFQTALIQVEYIDTGRGERTFVRHAFVLEDEDVLAERLGGRVYEPVILKEDLLNREQLALFTFFEYMIANTDWAFANRHNVEIITHRATNSLLVLPYDFDYSGLVGTPYAVPHPEIPIKDVRERYNKGICLTMEEALAARMLYLERRDDVEAACRSIHGADERLVEHVMGFLDEFYKGLRREKSVKFTFVRNCRPLEE